MQNFFDKLLSARQLLEPDGRKLYEYRLSDDEFITLQKLLSNKLECCRRNIALFGGNPDRPLAEATRQFKLFPELFVLYAAEWWRQNGACLAWEPILLGINATEAEWDTNQRNDCIEQGFRGWKLKLNTIGKKYIGSIALQAGLPLRLLAGQQATSLGGLLGHVLKHAAQAQAAEPTIQSWVENQKYRLPQTYQQESIYKLLTQVIITILELTQQAGLNNSQTAITALNQHTPNWRERFPLPINDQIATGLLERLICDATRIRLTPAIDSGISLKRSLAGNAEQGWFLQSSLELPLTLSEEQLRALFKLNPEELTRQLQLKVIVGEQEFVQSLRRITGSKGYRVALSPMDIDPKLASAEHRLELSNTNDQCWLTTVPNGAALDHELPWIFDSTTPTPEWIAQGSVNLSAKQALLVVPTGWSLNPTTHAQKHGQLLHSNSTVWLISDNLHLSTTGLNCRVQLGTAPTNTIPLIWSGNRWWNIETGSNMIFCGCPQTQHDLRWFQQNTTVNSPLGMVEARIYNRYGELQQRTRLAVLPHGARLTLKALDAYSGQIQLCSWKAASFNLIESEHINSTTNQVGDDLVINLSTQQRHPPQWLKAEVRWANSPAPLLIRFPFPAQGVRGFDSQEQIINSGSQLSISQLLGVRLLCLSDNTHSQIQVKLYIPNTCLEIKHSRRWQPNNLHIELRLLDFREEIDYLFSNTDQLDARLFFEIYINHSISYQLQILRYPCSLQGASTRVYLNSASFNTLNADLSVMALRLDTQSDEEPLKLVSHHSEGVETGSWLFDPAHQPPGCWLIYPAADCPLSFRPLLWPIPAGDVTAQEESELAAAIRVKDPEQRAQALSTALEQLAHDFAHPDWAQVEYLARELGHLPLAALDLWRSCTRSNQMMAALALRPSSIPWEFIERFANELPFAWELLSFNDWCTAIHTLRQHVSAYPVFVLQAQLERCTTTIAASAPSLNLLLKVACIIATNIEFPEIQREIQFSKNLKEQNIIDRLFSRQDSFLQELFRRHSDDSWPTHFSQVLATVQRNPHLEPLLYSDTDDYRASVINLPIALAARTVGLLSNSFPSISNQLYHLRQHREFDPDWFDDAFNWSIAYFLNVGLLTTP